VVAVSSGVIWLLLVDEQRIKHDLGRRRSRKKGLADKVKQEVQLEKAQGRPHASECVKG
jgi:hypothetical protein